jgi:hypothetical protein
MTYDPRGDRARPATRPASRSSSALDVRRVGVLRQGQGHLRLRGQASAPPPTWSPVRRLGRQVPAGVDRGRPPRTTGRLEGADRSPRQEDPAGRRRPVRHPDRALKRGIEQGIANSILVKVNQIGTLSETLDAVAPPSTPLHRDHLAPLGRERGRVHRRPRRRHQRGQIKTGSASRSDRIAKYNQLLRIADELGDNAQLPRPWRPSISCVEMTRPVDFSSFARGSRLLRGGRAERDETDSLRLLSGGIRSFGAGAEPR